MPLVSVDFKKCLHWVKDLWLSSPVWAQIYGMQWKTKQEPRISVENISDSASNEMTDFASAWDEQRSHLSMRWVHTVNIAMWEFLSLWLSWPLGCLKWKSELVNRAQNKWKKDKYSKCTGPQKYCGRHWPPRVNIKYCQLGECSKISLSGLADLNPHFPNSQTPELSDHF